ncbi:MAG: hypothetical protein N4A71_17710 [Carboxylicivirga sp.]|jgi:hypothetical protein|nr:hypothetical protein [Carboxylicivirga sp.]
MSKYTLIAVMYLLLTSCSKNDDRPVTKPLHFNYDFASGLQDWVGGFADYPREQETIYELTFGHSKLPEPLDANQGSIRLSGINRSDDLFMFIKRKLGGLTPNQKYKVSFSVQIASDVSDGSPGVGGSPGSSVFIKAGVSTDEPQVIENNDGYYRINIDKGNQRSEGMNMKVIGDFANGTNDNIYTLKNLENSKAIEMQANDKGELWAIIGTDSGFESSTTIYYNTISITVE